MGATLEAFWKGPGKVFVEKHKVRMALAGDHEGEEFHFMVDISLDTNFVELRIDFFDISEVKYVLESLEFLGVMGRKRFDWAELSITKIHMVERHGARFQVIGTDPYFSVVFPSGDQTIDRGLIRGIAR